MSPICSTRALKNAKRIRALAPHIIPAKEPAAGYSSIVPFSILARIHKMSDQELATTLSSRPELFQVAKKLRRPPASALPTATLRTGPGRPRSALIGDPPFKGTLHFVQLTLFVQANNSTHSVSSADIETAIQYTNLAVKPLSAYCSQYGANRISVSQNILQFGQSIVGGRYNDDDVQHWVNQIISDNRLAKDSSCIIILNPREMVNTDANLGHHILGYHDKSDAPYIFVNVLGKGLTVQDKSNFYADTLSHEIAEMVCDPDVSWFNHEVCDGCAGNCANDWRNFFTDPSPSVADSYIGSAKGSDFPPKFPFTFFIASIARPSHADDCPAPENACAYEPPRPDGNDLASDLLSYGDAGTPGNVSSPMVVGFGGWLDFKFLFAGRNATGQDRIYAVDQSDRLLSYGDAGTPGNVSSPVVVGVGGWLDFKFLFAGRNVAGEDRIYAVDQNDQLLSYGDAGTPGNVSSPVVVGVGGWLDFKFLFAGRNVAGEDRIYAVDQNDQLLSYGDAGTPGNVSSPVVVGVGGWLDFKFLFAGRNVAGEDRIYAVDQNDQLLSYGDAGTPGNVSSPVVVGVGGWLDFKLLFAGRNLADQDRIYAVVA